MKVKDVIEKLLKLDQELDVWIDVSDGDDLSYSSKLRNIEEGYISECGEGIPLSILYDDDQVDFSETPKIALLW